MRGRFTSEGKWMNVRPIIDNPTGPTQVDEATDTYDTIEWLLKNVPNNNGRIGQWGISYPGFFTTAGILSRHPARKASLAAGAGHRLHFEDFHHNGALTQATSTPIRCFGVDPTAPRHRRGSAQHDHRGAPTTTTSSCAGRLKHHREVLRNQLLLAGARRAPQLRRPLEGARHRAHLSKVQTAVMTVGDGTTPRTSTDRSPSTRPSRRRIPGSTTRSSRGPSQHGGWSAHGG
ncbi:MAG: hypothetical protein IPG88_20755 [Gemmatimonadetes bacterium]|nr:hypothetical protein [Gemmatimonadota bacterium]